MLSATKQCALSLLHTALPKSIQVFDVQCLFTCSSFPAPSENQGKALLARKDETPVVGCCAMQREENLQLDELPLQSERGPLHDIHGPAHVDKRLLEFLQDGSGSAANQLGQFAPVGCQLLRRDRLLDKVLVVSQRLVCPLCNVAGLPENHRLDNYSSFCLPSTHAESMSCSRFDCDVIRIVRHGCHLLLRRLWIACRRVLQGCRRCTILQCKTPG